MHVLNEGIMRHEKYNQGNKANAQHYIYYQVAAALQHDQTPYIHLTAKNLYNLFNMTLIIITLSDFVNSFVENYNPNRRIKPNTMKSSPSSTEFCTHME